MRTELSEFLASEAEKNKEFFVLSGDHGYALFDEIRKRAPSQFINTGVIEQATVGCAAGMAKINKKVIVYGLASFIPVRVLEFIKINICYENLPVILLGDGAGTVYTTLGASHQCGEDIACLRTLPIKIYSPADKFEMKACLEEAVSLDKPCYIRIGKSDRPNVHSECLGDKFAPLVKLVSSLSDTAVFATGSMVSTAVSIGNELNISVYSCPVLSFFDEKLFIQELKKYKNVIAIEEHSIFGGLGSILSDLIACEGLGIRLKKIGISKYFTDGCGSYDYALKFHGLDEQQINDTIKKFAWISS